MESERVMSGIQPTGNLHLGRYFGAVQKWVSMQMEYDCYFGVVNYHAMTMPYKPPKLIELTWDVTFNLLSCGLKPENIFIQSMIPEHTELAWILGCYCSYGDLSRMTQFKDKSQQIKGGDKDAHISAGIFTYPILQAADILMYKAHKVPVGKDQEQHLELSRGIAARFNQMCMKEFFPIPQAMFTKTPKIMSTADPTIKMSASKGEKHNIDVFASPDKINKQIMSAVTDSGNMSGTEMSPGVENLFCMLKACGWEDMHDRLLEEYRNENLKYGILKEEVAQAVIDFTQPFRDRKVEIKNNKKEIKRTIKEATAKIREVAIENLQEVKRMSGLLN
jgi:tryptophanyl-tRNA synthetase